MRDLKNGLLAGGLLLLTVALSACSTTNSPEQTAAISATGQPAQAAIAAAPPLPDVNTATCDQLGAELASMKTAKIPDKLSQFGQSKYTPTSDEVSKFTRYVSVSNANKARCAPAKKQVAQATKKKTTTAAAATVTTKKKQATVAAQPAAPAAADTSAVEAAPAPAASSDADMDGDAAQQGVTTTVQ